MVTASQVLKAALQEILVQASEAPLQADEYRDAIFALNNMMFSFAADGTNLGYTEVSNLGDAITVPRGAIQGIVANLAVDLAPQYDADVPPALIVKAKRGLDAMVKLSQIMPTMAYPSTLPIGSGNEYDYSTRHFYPDTDEAILTESDGFIATESGTNGN